jgi:hypothetical protein
MTDEQYIDELFAREVVGMDTPGFRDFVLDLMGIIGERPRAGDVSSMHLAYTAGLEHGKEWTDERPTEPGEYWLSLCPDRRRPGADVERVTISIVERRKVAQTCRPGWTYIDAGPPRQSLNVIIFDDDLLTNYFDLRAAAFDGAKWSRRETPADPFKEAK